MAVETIHTTDGRDRELWEADNEGGIAESIECFIEGQSFSRSYSMIWTLGQPLHLCPVSKLHRRHKGRLGKRYNFLTEEGGE
jgi:hypothetical protein